jgi:hypothetical protein
MPRILNTKKFLFCLVVFFFVFIALKPVLAQSDGSELIAGFSVSPAIIDEQAGASGLFEYNVSVKNDSQKKISAYPIVRDLMERDGQGLQAEPPSENPDRSASLASWISFPRGVLELGPGESKDIQLTIKLSPYAKLGVYHAEIAFSPGSNLPDAENYRRKLNTPKISLRFNVEEKKIEQGEINLFEAQKEIFFDQEAKFTCRVSNTGTDDIRPSGEIRIYNRSGSEVAIFPISADSLAAGKTIDLSAECKDKLRIGRYKAKAVIEYGTGTPPKRLEDTAFFWVLPLPFALATAAGTLAVLSGLLYLLLRSPRRSRRIASAGSSDGVLNLRQKK